MKSEVWLCDNSKALFVADWRLCKQLLSQIYSVAVLGLFDCRKLSSSGQSQTAIQSSNQNSKHEARENWCERVAIVFFFYFWFVWESGVGFFTHITKCSNSVVMQSQSKCVLLSTHKWKLLYNFLTSSNGDSREYQNSKWFPKMILFLPILSMLKIFILNHDHLYVACSDFLTLNKRDDPRLH